MVSDQTTVAQVLSLRRIIEGTRKRNLPAALTFIDFTKAFDPIHRGKMFKIISAYSIQERLELSIEDMYNTKANVLSPDGETAMFDLLSGVLQGDILAPFLFIIVLDYAMRQANDGREEELGFTLKNRRRRRVKPDLITYLDFADGIALPSDQIKQAQELPNRVEQECQHVGLGINAKKTKFKAYNIEEELELKLLDGTKLRQVNDFK